MTINKFGRLLGACLIILSLSGCEKPTYPGTVNGDSQQSPPPGTDDSSDEEYDPNNGLSNEDICLTSIENHQGKQDYAAKSCASCHGEDGAGGFSPINFTKYSSSTDISDLAAVIHSTMPQANVNSCTGDSAGECAYDIAEYLVILNSCASNIAPVAIVGGKQNAEVGETVLLNGTSSYDQDGSIAHYQWQQVMSADSTAISVINADSQQASFVVPVLKQSETLQFRLTVTDDLGVSHFASMTINVAIQPPDETDPNSGDDGSGNPEGPELESCLSALENHVGKTDYNNQGCVSCHGDDGTAGESPINFSNYNPPNAIADMASIIHDTMPTTNVNSCTGDSEGQCAYDVAKYLLALQSCDSNLPPMADAGENQTVESGEEVQLSAENSVDQDGIIEDYLWLQVLQESSTPVTLINANSPQARFIAPQLETTETLKFKLIVTDNFNDSTSDTVTIQVLEQLVVGNERPTVDAGNNQTVSPQQTVNLSAVASDVDGDIVSYQWHLKSGFDSIDILNADQANASFVAPKFNKPTELMFEVSVTDNQDASHTDTLNITVEQYISDDSCAELKFHAGYVDYNQQCSGCHGATNEGGVGGVIDIQKNLSTLIAYTDNKMPKSDVSLCTGDSAGDCAFETIDYLIDSKVCESAPGQYANQTFTKVSPLKQLHKLTNSLGGRLPSTVEISAVQSDGENAIANIVNDLLEEDAFYDRLKEIYNDLFLMGKFEAEGSLGEEDRLDINPWDYQDWPGGWERLKFLWAQRHSERSFAQGITQLVNYLAREDKDYRELMTAQYVMASYYGAILMNASDEDLAKFTPIYTAQDVVDGKVDTNLYPYAMDLVADGKFALNYDPAEFHPITVPKKIVSGALSSEAWYARFVDTATNRNRHRVYQIYKQFLDVDILGLTNVRGDDATDVDGHPVMENPSCVTCHSVLDPVGTLLQFWSHGIGNRTGSFEIALTRTFPDDAFQAGFKGECVVMPGESTTPSRWPTEGVTCSTYTADELTGAVPNTMLWLGKRIVQDEGFVRATVKRLFEGLFGEVPVRIASFDRQNASTELLALEAVQKDYFDYWGQIFINSGYKMKTLIKEMVTSDYYAPASLNVSTPADSFLGAVNLRTPEMIQRRFLSELNDDWYIGDVDYAMYYGGLDYDSVTVRTKDIESIKVAMQSKFGNQATCQNLYLDFEKEADQRTLFPYIELGDSDDAKLIQSIQYLLLILQAQDLPDDHVEVTELVEYWKVFKSMAKSSGGSDEFICSEGGRSRDNSFTLHAWHSIVAVLVDDFDYLFE